MSDAQEIAAAEELLRLAMLNGDVAALDELIAPELVFTNHLGQVFDKAQDLAAHRSGALKFRWLAPSESKALLGGKFAVVTTRMNLAGTFEGVAFEGDFRYTRVWSLSKAKKWQVIAGHVSIVQP